MTALQTTSNCLPELNHDVVLDKSRFNRSIPVLVVGVLCNRDWSKTCTQLRPYFPPFRHIPKEMNTYKGATDSLRKLLPLQLSHQTTLHDAVHQLSELNLDINIEPYTDEELSSWDILPEPQLSKSFSFPEGFPQQAPTLQPQSMVGLKRPGLCSLQIGYDNLNLEQVLKEFLPDHVSPVTGFTVMGHIAHFNLKEDALPYRHLIGQIVLDKIANVRTVIHKAASINSDYRTFHFDLMAGEPNFVTVVKESNCSFHLDASKVYWNSRLSTEHGRIMDRLCRYPHSTESVKPHQVVVYDVFAGVGPFSIPAARLGCREVHANDLNPESFNWLQKNITANKSKRRPLDNIHCYNMDGRVFIRDVLLPHYKESLQCSDPPKRYVVIMNLPAMAPDFLDAFAAVYTSAEATVPLDFYCYCFLRRNLESEDTVKNRVATALGSETLFDATDKPGQLTLAGWQLRFVRNVAPYKDMFCAEFQLILPVKSIDVENGVTETKRSRLE